MMGDSEGPQMELAGKKQDTDLSGCSKDFFIGEGKSPSGWSSRTGEEMAHLVNCLLLSQSLGPPWYETR